MQVCEVFEIAADDEEMENAFVDRLEMPNESAGVRIADAKMEMRGPAGATRARFHADVEPIRLVVGDARRHERHAADRTPLARTAANVGVHGAPVERAFRRGRLLRSEERRV